MNFQDRSRDSVQSLLAQLRAAQDDTSSLDPKTSSSSHTGIKPNTSSNASAKRPRPSSGTSSRVKNTGSGPTTETSGSVPSSRQLQDLLSSLGHPPPQKPRTLIDPFGPISTTSTIPAPPAVPSERNGDTSRMANPANVDTDGDRTVDEADFTTMSFIKVLPIISELLSTPEFKAEVKRMKIDQDTLERRLWAKGEKVKAEHEKTTKTDKEIAKITGKPISPVKEREWKSQLSDQMDDFHRHSCLPAIDSLAMRHRDRLEQFGVPGLGGDMEDPKARDRVRRIMDVLEGSLDE